MLNFHSNAQHDTRQQFNVDNGLPSNEVYNLYQDKNGILWGASDQGVFSYDGEKVTLLESDIIPKMSVLRFYPQKDGTVWFITSTNELFYIDPDTYKVHAYPFNELLKKESSNGVSNCVYINEKNVKVAFWDRYSFVEIDAQGRLVSSLENARKLGDSAYVIMEHFEEDAFFTYKSVFKPKSHSVLTKLSAKEEQYHYSSRNGKYSLISNILYTEVFFENELVYVINTGYRPLSCGFLSSGEFWIAYLFDGIRFYDLSSGIETRHIIPENSGTFVLTDHQNALWASSLDAGICYLGDVELNSFRVGEFPAANMFTTRSGEIVAVDTKGGLHVLNANNVFERRREVDIFPDAYKAVVRSASTEYGKPMFPIDDGHCVVSIIDALGDVGVVANLTGLSIVLANNKKECVQFNERISCLKWKSPTRLLIGGMFGVMEYNLTTGNVRKVYPQITEAVVSIDVREDILIVGTKRSGIYLLNGEKQTYISKSEWDNLLTDQINTVKLLNDSTAWVGTGKGVNLLSFNRNNSFGISVDAFDQFSGINVRKIELHKGSVWLATNHGVYKVNPEAPRIKRSRNLFFLQKKHVLVNHDYLKNYAELEYWQNSLELNFHAISFIPNRKMQFRYRINGREWYYTTKKKVDLVLLSPGMYEVEVQVGVDGVWSNERIFYSFEIYPPYYKRPWFVVSTLILLVTLVYLFFRFNILKYNKHIVREILRSILRWISRGDDSFEIKEGKTTYRIQSSDILFVTASRNYCEIHLPHKKCVVRMNISRFPDVVPDPMEYLQVNRSAIIRIDKIEQKSKQKVWVNNKSFSVGRTFQESVRLALFEDPID